VIEAGLAEGRAASGLDQAQTEAGYLLAMRTLVDPERFPDAARLFAADPFQSDGAPAVPSPDADFDAGLETILDGIAVAVASSSSS
jgi:hypothetical protein